MNDNERTNRPVSTAHLVFGIVFTGIAAVKFIGEATNANLPRSAIGFPVVLIGAGIVGLIATVVNTRRRALAAAAMASSATSTPVETSPEPRLEDLVGADDETTTILETGPHGTGSDPQEES